MKSPPESRPEWSLSGCPRVGSPPSSLKSDSSNSPLNSSLNSPKRAVTSLESGLDGGAEPQSSRCGIGDEPRRLLPPRAPLAPWWRKAGFSFRPKEPARRSPALAAAPASAAATLVPAAILPAPEPAAARAASAPATARGAAAALAASIPEAKRIPAVAAALDAALEKEAVRDKAVCRMGDLRASLSLASAGGGSGGGGGGAEPIGNMGLGRECCAERPRVPWGGDTSPSRGVGGGAGGALKLSGGGGCGGGGGGPPGGGGGGAPRGGGGGGPPGGGGGGVSLLDMARVWWASAGRIQPAVCWLSALLLLPIATARIRAPSAALSAAATTALTALPNECVRLTAPWPSDSPFSGLGACDRLASANVCCCGGGVGELGGVPRANLGGLCRCAPRGETGDAAPEELTSRLLPSPDFGSLPSSPLPVHRRTPRDFLELKDARPMELAARRSNACMGRASDSGKLGVIRKRHAEHSTTICLLAAALVTSSGDAHLTHAKVKETCRWTTGRASGPPPPPRGGLFCAASAWTASTSAADAAAASRLQDPPSVLKASSSSSQRTATEVGASPAPAVSVLHCRGNAGRWLLELCCASDGGMGERGPACDGGMGERGPLCLLIPASCPLAGAPIAGSPAGELVSVMPGRKIVGSYSFEWRL